MKLIILLLFPTAAIAQLPTIDLSHRHVEKLERLSGEKRLKQYLAYYKSDSARQMKKYLSAFEDSIQLSEPAHVAALPDYIADNANLPAPERAEDEILSQVTSSNVADGVKYEASKHSDKISNLKITEVPDKVLNSARKSVSKIFSKYREFANSEDLTHAVRQTSLEALSFKERIVPSFNFSFRSLEPFVMDLQAALGYKINARLQTGVVIKSTVGATPQRRMISAEGFGYSVYTNYEISQSIFAYGEFARNSFSPHDEVTTREWGSDVRLGIGKKILIHPKLYFTVAGLYLVTSHESPIHPDRFTIRFGFQFSELANRKLRPYYDPNK
jgi:hypothetical protein